MRNLILNSLFLFLLWTNVKGQTTPIAEPPVNKGSSGYWNPVFPDTFQKGLFRMNLDIGKHRLSGVLMIKHMGDTSTRIIYANEMGMRFFDFEFLKGNFIVHYIFPSMNKKMLLSLLRKDFALILGHEKLIRKITFIKNTDATTFEYKVKSTMGTFYYLVINDSRMIREIKSSGGFMSKTVIHPDYRNNSRIPAKISILNPKIKLSILMTYLVD